MCRTVFSMIKGKNTFSLFLFLFPFSRRDSLSSLKLLCPPAGTPLWAAWTTPVETRPCRWWMGGGWRDTGQPTSWRTKKKRETPAPDAASLLTVSPVAEFQISDHPPVTHIRLVKTQQRHFTKSSCEYLQNICRMRL